jgi:acetolactate synthase I/III small subunit
VSWKEVVSTMSKRTAQTLILLVDNEFGVLTRVTASIRREGWNIRSLVVAETMDAAVSRLTISVECIDSTLPNVLERLGRLACVRSISAYSDATHFRRELILVTMSAEHRKFALHAGEAIGAHVIEGGKAGALTLEFSGVPEQAESLLAALKPLGIVNVARSGIVTLERPAKEEARP